MKNCTTCKTELATSLDEYGPFHAPLCRDCFQTAEKETPNKIQVLEDKITELEEYNRSFQLRIDNNECEIQKYKDQIAAIKKPTRFDDLPIFQVH
jgi:hypothetical protein